jgi:hypothetical protein
MRKTKTKSTKKGSTVVAAAPSRNKHDLCDMANWLVKISGELKQTGMTNLQISSAHLQKFAKRMKEIAQLV